MSEVPLYSAAFLKRPFLAPPYARYPCRILANRTTIKFFGAFKDQRESIDYMTAAKTPCGLRF